LLIFITIVLYSAPSSPASVRHNGLEGREEEDVAINGYLAESDRKPISGLSAMQQQKRHGSA